MSGSTACEKAFGVCRSGSGGAGRGPTSPGRSGSTRPRWAKCGRPNNCCGPCPNVSRGCPGSSPPRRSTARSWPNGWPWRRPCGWPRWIGRGFSARPCAACDPGPWSWWKPNCGPIGSRPWPGRKCPRPWSTGAFPTGLTPSTTPSKKCGPPSCPAWPAWGCRAPATPRAFWPSGPTPAGWSSPAI